MEGVCLRGGCRDANETPEDVPITPAPPHAVSSLCSLFWSVWSCDFCLVLLHGPLPSFLGSVTYMKYLRLQLLQGFVTSKVDFNCLNSGNFPSLCWAHSTFLWDNSFCVVDREERKVSVTFSKTFMVLTVEVHTCQSQHLGVQVRRILSSSQLGLHNKALPQ